MSFVVQDPDAPADDANAYISIAEFEAYHDDRGNGYTATDTEIEQAIVRATDYIDARWTFAGSREDGDQSTECPRSGVYSEVTGYELPGYPDELKEACSEYAMSAIAGSLSPTALDPSGYQVKKVRKKADVIEKETEYFSQGKTAWKAFSVADGKMKRTRLLSQVRRTLGRS